MIEQRNGSGKTRRIAQRGAGVSEGEWRSVKQETCQEKNRQTKSP